MNRRISGYLALGYVVALCLGRAVPASADAPQAPLAAPQFKAGDTPTIDAEGAGLMVGATAVATLTKGQQVVVVEVRDTWVGVYASVGGEKKSGWVRTADFLPAGGAANPVGQAYSVARPVLPEPTPASAGVRIRPAADCPPGDGAADAYRIGYYDRHETDPNVHSWEPWRY